jgi:hypothetical protein
MNQTTHRLRTALATRDLDAIVQLLADNVVFRSPVVYNPYHGRDALSAPRRGLPGLRRVALRATDQPPRQLRPRARLPRANRRPADRRLRLSPPRSQRPGRRVLRHGPPAVRRPRPSRRHDPPTRPHRIAAANMTTQLVIKQAPERSREDLLRVGRNEMPDRLSGCWPRTGTGSPTPRTGRNPAASRPRQPRRRGRRPNPHEQEGTYPLAGGNRDMPLSAVAVG